MTISPTGMSSQEARRQVSKPQIAASLSQKSSVIHMQHISTRKGATLLAEYEGAIMKAYAVEVRRVSEEYEQFRETVCSAPARASSITVVIAG